MEMSFSVLLLLDRESQALSTVGTFLADVHRDADSRGVLAYRAYSIQHTEPSFPIRSETLKKWVHFNLQ